MSYQNVKIQLNRNFLLRNKGLTKEVLSRDSALAKMFNLGV
jgi:hypothetical protein